ncbi:class I SAM-dependent methyltransferase [Sorangium sp. So ce134]
MYDFVALTVSSRLTWKCPSEEVVNHYTRHVSANHLDVGVGTGYFLDLCRFPVDSPRLFLMDLNTNSLEAAARRVSRYNPQTLRRNVLDPIEFDGEPFDSIGLNYIIHCLPGAIPAKAVLFDHLRPLLKPEGVVFGTTLLSEGVERNLGARLQMKLYNKKGFFSNAGDTLADLQTALEERFRYVTIRTVGCAAIFSARGAK